MSDTADGSRHLGDTVEEFDSQWFATDSPLGRVSVAFAPRNELDVLDHDLTLPSGESSPMPMRVNRDDLGGDGSTGSGGRRQRGGLLAAAGRRRRGLRAGHPGGRRRPGPTQGTPGEHPAR
ncbi:hypothetical protein [Streptomyces sp. NPDC047097]|uniref:hypothetical protein n=1 Tax=Streptomyces sp. NPDC047097 TaxID=3155260 RepID=UPI0033FC1033